MATSGHPRWRPFCWSPGSSTKLWPLARSLHRTSVAFEPFRKTFLSNPAGGEGDAKTTDRDLKQGEDGTPEKLIWPQMMC